MDQFLRCFLSDLGQPTEYVAADEAILNELANKVPSALIKYWRELGFSVFRQGLLTLCNPIDWQPVVDEWIVGTELTELDQFIPVMLGPMGKLKLFGLRQGYRISLLPLDGAFIGTRDKAQHGLETAAKVLFLASTSEYEIKDEQFTLPQALP